MFRRDACDHVVCVVGRLLGCVLHEVSDASSGRVPRCVDGRSGRRARPRRDGGRRAVAGAPRRPRSRDRSRPRPRADGSDHERWSGGESGRRVRRDGVGTQVVVGVVGTHGRRPPARVPRRRGPGGGGCVRTLGRDHTASLGRGPDASGHSRSVGGGVPADDVAVGRPRRSIRTWWCRRRCRRRMGGGWRWMRGC